MARPREIPSAAKFWSLRCHTTVKRRHKETGKTYQANVTRQMTGEPNEDGEVAQAWPVSEFSVRAILERWGEGKYTAEWLDKGGKKVGEHKFTAGEPAAGGSRGAAAAAADVLEEGEDVGAMTLRLPKTQLEWIMWQQQREERAERRRRDEAREERDRMRADADERAQRDREFLSTIAGHGASAAAIVPAAAAGAMTPETFSRELGLMRRELLLAQREQAIQIRQELGTLQAEAEGGAENFTDALNSAGVGLVEGVGEQMPELVGGLLGKLRAYLKISGHPATPQDVANIIEAVRAAALAEAQANGAGGGGN